LSQADLLQIIDSTILVLVIAIIARSLCSYFMDPRNAVYQFLFSITEPFLAPLRAIMPRMGMFDLTPMAAILILQFVVRPVLHAALT
jgi:YggT family protein